MKPIIALLFVAFIAISCEKPESETQSQATAKQIEGRWFLDKIVVSDETESQVLTKDWKPMNYEFLASGEVKIYVNDNYRKTHVWSYNADKDEISFFDLFDTPFVAKVIALSGESLILESLVVIEGTTRAELANYHFKK